MNKIGLIAGVLLVYSYSTFSAAQQQVVITPPTWNQLEKNRQQELNNRVMDKIFHGGMSIEGAMISEGFDPSFFDSGQDNQQDNWGTEGFDVKDKTALLRAARHGGYVDVVKSLVNQGADVNYMDANKWSPLMAAITGGGFETVKFLVDNGADVNARDQHEWTPLMLAAKDGDLEAVKLLVEKGAEVNAKNSSGKTALYYATQTAQRHSGNDVNNVLVVNINRVVEYLKKHGATE